MSAATLPAPQTTSNADGTQTIVSYRINDAGRKVKVTRKVSVELLPAETPETRRTWAKYGEAVRESVKPQTGEEVILRLVPKTAVPAKENERGDERKAQVQRLTCKFCQGEHFTFKCPLKDKLATAGGPLGGPSADAAPGGPGMGGPGMGGMPSGPGGPGGPGAGMAGGRYVPPALRGGPGMAGGKYVPPALRSGMGPGMGGPGNPMGMMPGMMGRTEERDDSATLRVSNLPDEIQEADLRSNFSKVARVVRCHLARNKATGRSRGFAFIAYNTREEAELAKQTFDGLAVENMIMHVDFAEPRV